MHEYDTTLKTVVVRLTPGVIRMLIGAPENSCDEIVRWHNLELPDVVIPRVDLLGETASGTLVHIELQSTNDPAMAMRMLQYAVGVRDAFGSFPQQVVLYTGQARMRMSDRIETSNLGFNFRIVDIRDLDAEPLLASPHLDDNVIAVLTRLTDERQALRRILSRIAKAEPVARAQALADLALLTGLRNLATILEQETKAMPILNDIMDHELFGPKIREGIAIGLQRGREEAERDLVHRLLEKRFGPIPAWAKDRLKGMSLAQVDSIALRLLDGSGLEQLLS